MSGNYRPSLMPKVIDNVKRSGLSVTDKKCIITALEKQIPKKPLEIEKYFDEYYGKCPSCNKIVSDWGEDKRCDDCGQALDWSDT